MAKIRQFGSVLHTGGSSDGEERVVESVRQHVRDDDRAVGQNDDCEVVEDEAEAGFENEVDENGIGVEEEIVGDLRDQFGDVVQDEVDNYDGDSGDDIWNDDTIPDPLSSDDDEEELERREEVANTQGCEEFCIWEKCMVVHLTSKWLF